MTSYKAICILNHSGANLAGHLMYPINGLVSSVTNSSSNCFLRLSVRPVPFEEEDPAFDASKRSAPPASSPTSPHSKSSRLGRFLEHLSIRPNDPPLDNNELGMVDSTSAGGISASSSMGLSSAPSASNLVQASTVPVLQSAPPRNPEADSFAYMETLLESLAMLGKLGSGLDVVAQKLPAEIFALVAATIEEVSERAEYGRRGSLVAAAVSSASMSLSSISGVLVSPMVTSNCKDTLSIAATLRLAGLESTSKVSDQETLRDLFWTLYSKLDAVAQGLRVVYEISNRIGSVSTPISSTETALISLVHCREKTSKTLLEQNPVLYFHYLIYGCQYKERFVPCRSAMITLLKGVIVQVRTLLQDYITDEEKGTVSSRNPIVSINEVLREGRYHRDKSKVDTSVIS